MHRQKERSTFLATISGLGWPLLLGAATTSLFYALVYRGPLNTPQMHRYFATHPVAFVEMTMFFIGVAALLMKAIDVVGQYVVVNTIQLEEAPAEGQSVQEAQSLIAELRHGTATARNSYQGRRLLDALLFVRRKGSAEGLDDELKYLADMDAARQQDSYSLVRILIWATPMLGFLGTVVGITQALGGLDVSQLATDAKSAMDGLLSGLYVAFDTTALALTLSIVLMFVQFLIDRVETQLLQTVDLRTNEMMVGRFREVGSGKDPHLASVQRMAQHVIETSEGLLQQQTTLWKQTIDEAQSQWHELQEAASSQLTAAIAPALSESLIQFQKGLAQAEREASDRAQARWEQWQATLSQNARLLQSQQTEMVRQGEVLAKVVEATGDVISLERSLNENLRSLAGAKNFEDTVMSLAAAIHLLSTRLDDTRTGVPQIDLSDSTAKGQAA